MKVETLISLLQTLASDYCPSTPVFWNVEGDNASAMAVEGVEVREISTDKMEIWLR